ncbi:DUF1660 family phage protein [Altericroceibacterium spongiae]
MLELISCRLFGHKINRSRVWNDGSNYKTKCQRCGKLGFVDKGYPELD